MMTSNKPYLIRALYEWLLDNGATPHILVDTSFDQVMVPSGIAKDGQVVLNISATAVQRLEMDNDHIAFSARFGGVSQNIYIPIQAVLAIYSMEDGEGMMFAEEVTAATPQKKGPDSSRPNLKASSKASSKAKSKAGTKAKKPGLKIVK